MGNINDRIKQIYDYKRFKKYSEFAESTGLSHQTASNYIKGKQKPDIEKLAIIQKAFDDINPIWLLIGEGEMLKSPLVIIHDYINLREERLKHNLTQKELADKLGVSLKTIQAWEFVGETTSLSYLNKIFDFFKLDKSKLNKISENDNKNTENDNIKENIELLKENNALMKQIIELNNKMKLLEEELYKIKKINKK